MTKSDDLKTLVKVFASGIAEHEHGLAAYFVETPMWEQLCRDEKHVLLGAKGSGKSALFTLLLSNPGSLPAGTVIIGAERPIHETALFKAFFRGLADTPAPDAIRPQEFQFLWKAYFLILIADELRQRGITNEPTRALLTALRRLGLIPPEGPNRLFEALKKVVGVVLRGEIRLGTTVDPHGNQFTMFSLLWRERLQLTEEQQRQREASLESLTQLFDHAEAALATAQPPVTVWLALDRLDDVFPDTDSGDVERDALGALLTVYTDLQARRYEHLRLKIFLRSDIFRRITRHRGFRNLSHVEPSVHLTWSDPQLRSLIVLRCAQSERVRARYELPGDMTEAVQLLRRNEAKREALFKNMFPASIEVQEISAQGKLSKVRKPDTMAWIREQLADGDNQVAPRDVIKLISFAIDGQLVAGDCSSRNQNQLFSSDVLRAAAVRVSETHVDTVFRAEYHHLVDYIEVLTRGTYEYSLAALEWKWSPFTTSPSEVERLANELLEERFFSKRPTKGGAVAYVIAPLYRSALELHAGHTSPPDWYVSQAGR